MLKKMLISMLVMTFFLTGGALYYFYEVTDGTFGAVNNKSWSPEKSFSNENYIYYLNDSKIREAIEAGTASVELMENYLLETVTDTTDGDKVAFAYVETPFLKAVKESRKIFDLYGRYPVPDEIKEELMDQYLPVNIRFYDNAGFVFDVDVHQETEIYPADTKTAEGGAAKTIYLKVDDLDFSEPLTILAADRVNESVALEFNLEFDDYKP